MIMSEPKAGYVHAWENVSSSGTFAIRFDILPVC